MCPAGITLHINQACCWTHYQCNSGDVSWILRRFFDARGGANRLRSEGREVDMDRTCHIPIQFLGDKLRVLLWGFVWLQIKSATFFVPKFRPVTGLSRRFGVLFANQTDNGGKRGRRMKGRQTEWWIPGGTGKGSCHEGKPPCDDNAQKERKCVVSKNFPMQNHIKHCWLKWEN